MSEVVPPPLPYNLKAWTRSVLHVRGRKGGRELRKITSKHQHSTSVSFDFHPTPPECEVCHCGLATNGYTSYPNRHSPSRFVSALRKAPTASPVHVRSVTGPSDLDKVEGHTGDEHKMSRGNS